MELGALLDQFGDDPTTKAIAAVVALDIILGVAAAIKAGTFRLSYLVDFLRNDVLGKVVPYAGLWWVLHITGDVEIGGFEAIEETVGIAIIAAVGASVLNSIRDLGLLPGDVPDAIAGPDPNAKLEP